MLFEFLICFIAGIGAGLGTGFAGMSAAAVISPMLITFLDVPAYQAVGIALASDVLASGVSAYTYHKNKNLDIKNGLVMMFTVLIFTFVAVGNYGNIFNGNDFATRHKVYCEAGYDNQRKNAGSISKKENCTIYYMRNHNRTYLRLCRCRRRNDDASHSYNCIGL